MRPPGFSEVGPEFRTLALFVTRCILAKATRTFGKLEGLVIYLLVEGIRMNFGHLAIASVIECHRCRKKLYPYGNLFYPILMNLLEFVEFEVPGVIVRNLIGTFSASNLAKAFSQRRRAHIAAGRLDPEEAEPAAAQPEPDHESSSDSDVEDAFDALQAEVETLRSDLDAEKLKTAALQSDRDAELKRSAELKSLVESLLQRITALENRPDHRAESSLVVYSRRRSPSPPQSTPSPLQL